MKAAKDTAPMRRWLATARRTNCRYTLSRRGTIKTWPGRSYKLLPAGEVMRMFWIDPSGLARVGGHPEWDFPPTEPSYLTVYMDDGDLCKFKGEWIRAKLRIDLRPSKEVIAEAMKRQRARFGKYYVRHRRDCSFSWR